MAHGFKPAEPGTVSHGTLNDAHLFQIFGNKLHELIQMQLNEDLDKEQVRQLIDLQNTCSFAQMAAGMLDRGVDPDSISDDMSEEMALLMDALDLFAPDGHTFGAHEGDGSDFGYWPIKED